MGQNGGWFWFIGIKSSKTGTSSRMESYWDTKKLGTQSAFTCSKLTIETLEQGMKYVQS